jgi:hypothetical protein
MILLDTNVVSETMRSEPNANVLSWLDAQTSETLLLSSITIAELSFGVSALPEGRRKSRLLLALSKIWGIFNGRILPFDAEAARCYGEIAAVAKSNGHGFPVPDGYIAAIAVVHGLAVASRDATAFRAAGLTVIDPWNADA